MRAIHINVQEGTVTEVELTGGNQLTEMQKHVGGYIEVAPVKFENGDVLFVDEEGLYKQTEWFGYKCEDGVRYFKGNGLLCGGAGEDTASARSALTDIAERVEFITNRGMQIKVANGEVK